MSLLFSDGASGTTGITFGSGGNVFIGQVCSTGTLTISNNSTAPIINSGYPLLPKTKTKREIAEENLSVVYPPSETTRLHRKKVRVTDLARPAIYVLYFYDEIVYVGQSKNAYARMAQHIREKEFTHIRIMSCRKDRMNYWEQKLIDALEPTLNITHNKRNLRLVK